MRFSIKRMLAAVAGVAIGCAALLNANAVWAGLLYGVAIIAICAAILGIIYRKGRHRAFWCGFAVFGWASLLLMGANPNGGWAVRLPSYQLMRYLHRIIVTEERVPLSDPRVSDEERIQAQQQVGVTGTTIELPDRFAFYAVGQWICLLLFALLGGFIGCCFHASASQKQALKGLE